MPADTDADTALGAYWRFFESFNSRDPVRFSGVLHYPHMRVSPGQTPVLVPTAAAHAAAMSWQGAVASGWDHTEGHEPQLLHSATDRAHIVGGWTHVDAHGEPVLVNHAVYIATRINGDWGMQCRFGTDSGDAAQSGASDAHHQRALAMVGEYIDAYNDRHWARCVGLLTTPHFQVDVGRVREWPDRESLWATLRDGSWHFVTPIAIQVAQGGNDCVAVAFEGMLDGGDVALQGIFFVVRRNGVWGIQARSIIAE